MNIDDLPSQKVPLQTVQIIAGALIAAPLAFAIVAIVVTANKAPGEPTIGYVALAFSVVCLVLSSLAPDAAVKVLLEKLRSSNETGLINAIFGIFQTRVIIRSALVEGASFLCGVAYMTTARWWTLAALLVLVSVMIFRFPTSAQFDNWVRDQQERYSLTL